jgi:pimeloyl-ACP methyl ester carboxylesterase
MHIPLLLLHGALGAKQQLNPLISALPASWNCQPINLPGHGGLPANQSFSIEKMTEFVLQWLDNQNYAQIDIFGYSMGGYVALWLAHTHPTRVRSIFTLGTQFDWTPESAAKEAARLNPAKIAEKVPAFALQLEQLHAPEAARLNPAKIAEKVPAFALQLEQLHAPEDWQQVVHQTADLLTQLGANPLISPQVLQSIQQPVWVTRGSEEQMVSRETSETAAQNLPNGHFMELLQTKHPLEQVDPALLAQMLGKWRGKIV